jgi:hypothetical protein
MSGGVGSPIPDNAETQLTTVSKLWWRRLQRAVAAAPAQRRELGTAAERGSGPTLIGPTVTGPVVIGSRAARSRSIVCRRYHGPHFHRSQIRWLSIAAPQARPRDFYVRILVSRWTRLPSLLRTTGP